ncbi:MAG: hypothetical protein NTX03_07485 [Bacteroidetes bacterium]|nr:hypothetical protein [Bacteroidota bacterium]
MSRTELREKIIATINGIEDELVLQEIYRLLEVDLSEEEVYNLSALQKEKINKAIDDINAGNTLSDDAANKQIDEWLG